MQHEGRRPRGSPLELHRLSLSKTQAVVATISEKRGEEEEESRGGHKNCWTENRTEKKKRIFGFCHWYI